MKRRIVLGTAVAAFVALASSAAAQSKTAPLDAPDAARTVLGATVSASGTDRDTLGLLISAVTPGGPADRAGVESGTRVAEINGVSLRIDPADVGRRESQDAAMRRLAHELLAVQPGDSVMLRLFAGGRVRRVTIQTSKAAAPPADVAPRPATQGTLTGVIDGISDLRTQLYRLAQDEALPARRDTLMRAQLDLGAVERHLRAAQGAPPQTDNNAASPVPGLLSAAIGDELTDYFGDESKGGFLVLECDSSWTPLRTGDVILRVDGEAPTLDRLRTAADPRRQARVDLLRRGRPLTVTLHAPA